MTTEMSSPSTNGSRRGDPLRVARLSEENRALVARLRKLRTALEAAVRENAELRRELARLGAENEHLRGVSRAREMRDRTARGDRVARIRVMLQDRHSRNP